MVNFGNSEYDLSPKWLKISKSQDGCKCEEERIIPSMHVSSWSGFSRLPVDKSLSFYFVFCNVHPSLNFDFWLHFRYSWKSFLIMPTQKVLIPYCKISKSHNKFPITGNYNKTFFEIVIIFGKKQEKLSLREGSSLHCFFCMCPWGWYC